MTDQHRNKPDFANSLLTGPLRFIWHLLFWAAGFLVLYNLFRTSGKISKIDIIYTLFFLAPLVIGVYINLYLLIPRLLRRQKFMLFLLSEGAIVGAAALFIYLLFDRWIDLVLKDYYFIVYDDFSILLLYAAAFILLSTLFKLSKEWIVLLRRERQENLVQFRNLQSQINPHFLLNSLQTIYSQSLNHAPEAPATVLKLAEILKFSLYESEGQEVSLERELEVVSDYVEIYRMRMDPVRARITLHIDGDTANHQVAPLIFLPFIENSIKHGIQATEREAFVDIKFTITEKMLNFVIENNTGSTDAPREGKYRGIGIGNTRKRLELLYPGRHRLEISKKQDVFHVNLSIIF